MRHTDTQTFDPSTSRSFLVDALRATSERLEKEDTKYQWGHMGQCNAGHLIQTVTGMDSFEIVQSVDFQLDEWSEHATDYCSCTGSKVEDIFLTMERYGMNHSDIVKLENLSDKAILDNLNGGFRYLRRNVREDVIEYMRSFADLLESAQTDS
jgi:hypothetical protein